MSTIWAYRKRHLLLQFLHPASRLFWQANIGRSLKDAWQAKDPKPSPLEQIEIYFLVLLVDSSFVEFASLLSLKYIFEL